MRILKIETLPTKHTWIDRDFIMLHACFQILTDAIEKEHVDTHCNYEAHKDFVDEVRFLYQWWKFRKFDEHHDSYNVIEQMNVDTQMLIRLMNIRTQLWT